MISFQENHYLILKIFFLIFNYYSLNYSHLFITNFVRFSKSQHLLIYFFSLIVEINLLIFLEK